VLLKPWFEVYNIRFKRNLYKGPVIKRLYALSSENLIIKDDNPNYPEEPISGGRLQEDLIAERVMW
jgi:hypothetical protein